jgi:hypothetical protein
MPLSPSAPLYLKHIPRPNVNALDAKSDETLQPKPRPKLVKWVRFVPGFRREENQATRPGIKYPGPLDPFDNFIGAERYQAKDVI